jgi:hypothetical protein
MVSDNPKSFADLDGHEQQIAQAAAGYCTDSALGSCNPQSAEDATAAAVGVNQNAGTAQSQSADAQLVVTMKITEPTVKIGPQQTETTAAFGVAQMDAKSTKGKIEPTDGQHLLKMTETLDKKKSKGAAPEICTEQCSGTLQPTHTLTDTMRVSGKQIIVLDKHFQIDGHDAKVVDPGTGRPHDFVHQVSSVKGGTNLTFGDNSAN